MACLKIHVLIEAPPSAQQKTRITDTPRVSTHAAHPTYSAFRLKILAVFVAVLGHIFPIFAGFRGGKGVATVLGAVTGIQPNIALLCFVVWLIVLMIWHYVSLASIAAGCSFPIFVSIFSSSIYVRHGIDHTSISFLVFSFVVAIALVWTHRKNVGRLLDGTESKIDLWKYFSKEIDIDKNRDANG